jgi:glutamate-ammonia-ligase adenylyltransferase
LVVLAMGKLGGREPNYHSDLDVIFLYGHDSEFESRLPTGVTSQFFFSELAANLTRFVTHSSRFGRLYELDSRLRPSGHSGALAVSIEEFSRYFQTGQGRLWERQSLCKARPIFGTPRFQSTVMDEVRGVLESRPWSAEMGREIAAMRVSMQRDCSERNLKRGIGGTVDAEFAIQALQLKHLTEHPSVLVPGTLEAIEALAALGLLLPDSAAVFSENYHFLRSVEAKLRLVNTTARHDLPTDEKQLDQLAHLLNMESAKTLQQRVSDARQKIHSHYERVFSS